MFKINTDEKEVYQKLIELGKSNNNSNAIIPKVAKYLDFPSNKIKAKVLWMLVFVRNNSVFENKCKYTNFLW